MCLDASFEGGKWLWESILNFKKNKFVVWQTEGETWNLGEEIKSGKRVPKTCFYFPSPRTLFLIPHPSGKYKSLTKPPIRGESIVSEPENFSWWNLAKEQADGSLISWRKRKLKSVANLHLPLSSKHRIGYCLISPVW